MAFENGYYDGYAGPVYAGHNYAEIAALALTRPKGPDVVVGNHYKVSDEEAARWIREAAERGYDVGRPRGDK